MCRKIPLLFAILIVPLIEAQVVVERGVKATMRDGTVLRADVYRPSAEGRYPVLLQRTPYNKSGGVDAGYRMAAAGYVAIIQDVRGRFTSEGEWYPFLHESQDGYDTVEWAASLPYSNGKVGMFGGSYVGATQMLTAIAHPPHLGRHLSGRNGQQLSRELDISGRRIRAMVQRIVDIRAGTETQPTGRIEQGTNATQGVWKLPLTDYTLFNSPAGSLDPHDLAPYFLDWLAHPDYDEYWKRWAIDEHYADITVPALTIAAWYDIFQGGSLRNYEGIEARRAGQHLLVTIGGHAGGGRKIGDVDFGTPAAEFDELKVTIEWYDYLFKGAQNRICG